MAKWTVVLALVACGKDQPEPPPRQMPVMAEPDAAPPADASEVAEIQVPVTAPARKLWIARIDDAATFDQYSEELGGERFAKLVIDLRSDAVYYFDVNVYKVHKDFIFAELYKKPKTKQAVRVFDKNYGAKKTDFMMCYLVHHLAPDVWTLAFWDGDLATAEQVEHAYKRMKETFYLGDKVKFRPDSSYQEKVAAKLEGVPVITNDQLYKQTDYVAFNQGIAVGKLRILAGADDALSPDDIVVVQKPLADITPVAGIIAEQFSTPLSHVSLRARAWGIPNIGLHGAADKLKAFAGKQVYFEAKGGDYVMREATADELAAKQAKQHKRVELPVADLTIKKLATLDEMRLADVVAYGTKASALGELASAAVPDVQVPPGFGVPFAYYDAHVRAAGIDKTIAAFLAAPPKDPATRKQKLAQIRKAIVEAPLAAELHAHLEVALAALPGADAGVFVRSSTNAEDLPDESGAGLYDTVPNVRGSEPVEAAIKQVWASVWNFAAYEDRQRAGIDQAKVCGATLVQIGVPATAAGVLLTEHPTDPTDERNYTINAKSGLGMSVVDGKAVPESLIVSWYNHGIRVLSRSAEDTKLVFDDKGGVREVPNPDAGKPVLTNAMAVRLADAARKLTKVFKRPRIDIEWAFVGDQLYIVQVRPLVR